MRSLLPRVLLPFVGSDLSRPPLSPWVVLSCRISVWTSDRYTSHPQASGQVEGTHFMVQGLTQFGSNCVFKWPGHWTEQCVLHKTIQPVVGE